MASSSLIRLLDAIQCPNGTGNWTYGSKFLLENHMTDFVLSAKCICPTTRVTVKYKVEHSPDGVRWSPIKDASGTDILIICPGSLTSDDPQTCAVKVIDVPVLPYIRAVCGEADSAAECDCTLDLYYTSFK